MIQVGDKVKVIDGTVLNSDWQPAIVTIHKIEDGDYYSFSHHNYITGAPIYTRLNADGIQPLDGKPMQLSLFSEQETA